MSQERVNTTGSEPNGPNPGQRPSRGGTRGGRGRQRWKRGHQTKHNFTGKTKEMNGHVFQLRVEQKKKAISGDPGTAAGIRIIGLQERN